jgi:hypothetical protein
VSDEINGCAENKSKDDGAEISRSMLPGDQQTTQRKSGEDKKMPQVEGFVVSMLDEELELVAVIVKDLAVRAGVGHQQSAP